MSFPHLFSPFTLGDITLTNRLVMAPMTRSRAIGNVPNALMVEYYTQRADAGLIITEGSAPSPNGLGYPRIPGMYSPEQIAGWRTVTDAVHTQGGHIFVQLMHVGRIGHPLNLPAGAELVAPSALQAPGEMFTDAEGPQPHPTPREMTGEDIAQAVAEFAASSKAAIEAGFDGVELHGANGYLIDQFLNPISNQRTDAYGGSDENRVRFALDVVRAVAKAIGKHRVGIRLSPLGAFNGLKRWNGAEDAFDYYAAALGDAGLAYMHVVDHSAMGAPAVPATLKARMRKSFGGTVILSGGYDSERAEADLAANLGELVAFGRPFLANPDLPLRFQKGAAMNPLNFDLFYTPGPDGYTDYPTLSSTPAVS
jgi:N-ethylmaleimide reductase